MKFKTIAIEKKEDETHPTATWDEEGVGGGVQAREVVFVVAL